MGTARVVVGMFFGLIISTLILFVINWAFPLTEYAALGTTDSYCVIFAQLISPYTTFNLGNWWVLLGIAFGALFGGFIAKSPGAGVGTGILCFLVSFILFQVLSIGFDLIAWETWIGLSNGNILADIVLSLGLFILLAAIGGKITAESD